MPITTSCDCGRKLNLKDELAGKTVKCPQCGTALKVPDSKSTATAVATPPPRSAPADSRIMPKPPSGKTEEPKAGPKVIMSNFKSLEDFDDAGNAKKKKKVFDDQDKTAHEEGTTGGEMAKIAAEAMKQADERPKARCPGCGRGVKPDDVICMKCGTNIKTGRRIGESAFAITPKKVMLALGIMAICAAGALWHFLKVPPITKQGQDIEQILTEKQEKEDTIAKLDALVNDADA
ncbi:MAG: hypothetical protein K8T20_08605, partial [Planctomycetes bacterium]|nr:hypothetical protein [Planctomycetota bacterium]